MRTYVGLGAWLLVGLTVACGDDSPAGGSGEGGEAPSAGGGSGPIGGGGRISDGGAGGEAIGGEGAGGEGGSPFDCGVCAKVATCDEADGTCTCPAGYDDPNRDGTTCNEIDECAAETDNCDAVATCSNTVGSFSCVCPPGYSNPNGDGTLCSNIDECARNQANCDANVGICVDDQGTFSCSCPAGYEDTNGDGSLCTDIDECALATDDCDALATCANIGGSFSCTCPSGYEDTNGDGSLCTDIDECALATDDCDPVATCANQDGGYSCTCPAGYEDTNGDGSLCTDLDECALGTANCSVDGGICTDTDGGFACTCAAGFFDENADGTSCSRLDLYYTSPFQNRLFQYDLTSNTTSGCIDVTMPGFTITGTPAMAKHPISGVTYVVVKVSGVTGRVLGTIDLATGVVTQIGNLGTNFSSLAWSNDGSTLYGTTGNGGNPSETLFTIDPATAATTVVQALGNGADGEVIAMAGDGTLFHWSGNGSVVMETVQIGTGTTNVPLTNGGGGETFGATFWPFSSLYGVPGPVFIIGNISSELRVVSPTGVYTSPALGVTQADARGLVFERDHAYGVCP